MILSISIKKRVADEAEAKKFAEKVKAVLPADKSASISAVVVNEIVKPEPMAVQPK